MIWDYNRGSCGPYGPNEVIECGADKFLDVVLADQAASSYVDGIAMHWYDDVQYNYNVSMLDKIHEAHSNKWLLYTEACAGFFGGDKVPALGNWTRAEQYTHDIIEDLNHWSTGWTDWNMALDYHGGPNWDNNFVDSPIIVSQDNTSFYKQPMFYALGHFSKFILPGSIRIGSKIDGANSSLLEGVAFQNPQNQTVLVLHNREAEAYQVAVKDSCSGLESSVLVEPYSISTLVWKSSPGPLTLKTCIRKNYDGPEPNMVCVCNSTYCDEFPPLVQLQPYQAAIYASSISGKRFENTTANFKPLQIPTNQTITIKLDASRHFQKIIGFGGAFTDSVGVNLKSLSAGAASNLMKAYFGSEGIGYTIGRVPIASTDFSDHEYSYADISNDFDLIHFNLTAADFDLKIPYIQTAKQLTGNSLRLFASPWSAPAWMKTNNRMKGGGQLKGDLDGPYYKTWANYFVKFFEEYAKHEIDFWGVTVQNEPSSGIMPDYGWQTMYFSPEMERDFIKRVLGPALRGSNLTKDLFLMILDDNRYLLPNFANVVLSDPEAAKYVNGIAVHWYEGFLFDPKKTLGDTHDAHPEVVLFASEACNGYLPILQGPMMGDWSRGIAYASDIIGDLQNWVTGWTDWNLCLDEQGGPTWAKNYVDAPIIVNKTSDEFYKQPMYYVMGHFSKFTVPNSLRVQLTFDQDSTKTDLDGVAFTTPTSQRVVVLQNRNMKTTYQVSIQDAKISGKALQFEIEPRSIVTIVWNKTSQ